MHKRLLSLQIIVPFLVFFFFGATAFAQPLENYHQTLNCYPTDTINIISIVEDVHGVNCTSAPVSVTSPSAKGAVVTTFNNKIIYTLPSSVFSDRDTVAYQIDCDGNILSGELFIMVVACPDNINPATCLGSPPATTWSISEDYLSSDIRVNSYGQPYVGDVDGCGKSEVVIWNHVEGSRGVSNAILIFDENINLKYEIPTGTTGTYQSPPDLALAFAKLHPDSASACIFVVIGTQASSSSPPNGHVECYHLVGGTWTQKWTTTTELGSATNVSHAACINIGDINNNGNVELYVDSKIFDAATGKLLLKLPSGTGTDSGAPRGKRQGQSPIMNLLADMNNDGTLEAVIGYRVYKLNINSYTNAALNSFNILYELPSELYDGIFYPDGWASVADMNLDGYLDVIISTNDVGQTHPYILVWDPQTLSFIGQPVQVTATVAGALGRGSRVFAGDVDNDGYPDLALISRNRISCFKNNNGTGFTEKWTRYLTAGNIHDDSDATYMCMFDFNQDGNNEIVYRDEQFLHIIDGSLPNGADMATIQCFSPTTWEGAIVADLNRDGHAQIIVTGNNTGKSTYDSTYLRVYSSSIPGTWAPARSVWNQYSYNAVNINEDLSVPQFQTNPATVFPGEDGMLGTSDDVRPYNAFLKQQTLLNKLGNPLWLIPNIEWDVDAHTEGVKGDTIVIEGCIKNTGAASMQAPIYVTFYKDDVSEDIIEVDTIETDLKVGATHCFSFTLKNICDFAPIDDIWISINDNEGVYPYQEQCELDGRRKVTVELETPPVPKIKIKGDVNE